MWIVDLEILGSSYAQICLELQLMFGKLQFGIRIMKTFFSTPKCFSNLLTICIYQASSIKKAWKMVVLHGILRSF